MNSSPASRRYRPSLPAAASNGRTSRQAQIRQAALELFAAHGYRVTTVDEIGARAGIRGPSVYKHAQSKQSLLVDIMTETMDVLLAGQVDALARGKDVVEQLCLAVDAHVRYHAEHAHEAFVGNREIYSLEDPHRSVILAKRRSYDLNLRTLIERGIDEGVFSIASSRLASYSILDLGMGVSVWFRADGQISEDELAKQYVEIALRIVGVQPAKRRRTKQHPREDPAS